MARRIFGTCKFPPADFYNKRSPLIAQTGWKRRTQRTQSGHAQHSAGKQNSACKELQSSPGGYNICPQSAATNLTHHWLASKLNDHTQVLANQLIGTWMQSAQGTATGPRRKPAHWYQRCPMPSQCPWQPLARAKISHISKPCRPVPWGP